MFRLLLAQFRLLRAKFGLRRVTLNSGVCLGYSVITIGHTGLGLGLVDSGVCFTYLVLSFGNLGMSWFLGVQVRLLLGTISLLRAKFGQLLSVLITLGQVSITLR